MIRRFSEILARLQERDYKLTPQRQDVVRVLLNHPDKHLSAEEVYNLVKANNPEIGLATVYRTLELLSELAILQKIDFGDGRSRYEFADEAHRHHHLVCLNCGAVEELDEDLLEPLENLVAERFGFHVTDHQVTFYGLCRACRPRENDL